MDRTNDDLRRVILRYFYERNQNATSEKGKRGSHVKISDVKKELRGFAWADSNTGYVSTQLSYQQWLG